MHMGTEQIYSNSIQSLLPTSACMDPAPVIYGQQVLPCSYRLQKTSMPGAQLCITKSISRIGHQHQQFQQRRKRTDNFTTNSLPLSKLVIPISIRGKNKNNNHTAKSFDCFFNFTWKCTLYLKSGLCCVLMMIQRMLNQALIYSCTPLIASIGYVLGQEPVANNLPIIDSSQMEWKLIFLAF